jgi:hypothetical protein
MEFLAVAAGLGWGIAFGLAIALQVALTRKPAKLKKLRKSEADEPEERGGGFYPPARFEGARP